MLRKAKAEDADRLADWREDDELELDALEGEIRGDERAAYLAECITKSVPAFTWEVDGEVLAIGGVTPVGETSGGLAWIVSSAAAHKRPWAFLRAALAGLNFADLAYDHLVVLSGSWLDNHHKWLNRLGFSQGGPAGPQTTIFERRCS